MACADDKLTFSGVHRYRDIARHNVVRRNAFAFNTTAIRVRDSFNHIEGNTFSGKSWSDTDESPPETVYALHDVVVDGALLKGVGEPAIGITVINNITMTETKTAGENFVQKHDATVLFANNMDRYYECLPDAIAPGNLCNPLTPQQTISGRVRVPGKEPLNRCEVRGIPAGCPSRDQMTQLPGVAHTWLATLYGANILPRVCEERAKAIWEYCADDEATITTTALVDGYVVETWSYDLTDEI